MPYQPTNPYPYNTAIDLQDGLQFCFKVDNYDTIESFKIELYDYLKNKKLYTFVRTVGDIQGNAIVNGTKQLLQILDENDEQILLEEYDINRDELSFAELPIKGGLGENSIGGIDISPYLKTIEDIKKRNNYKDTPAYEALTITNADCFEIDEEGTITGYDEDKNNGDKTYIVIPYQIEQIDVENNQIKQIDVKNIDINVFANNKNIQTVVVPACVHTIGEFAFDCCSNLQEVYLNYGTTQIGNYCFNGCTSLDKINLLDSIASIGSYAFLGCSSLKELILPNSLEEISEYCFSKTGITNLKMPAGLIQIEDYAFQDCTSLETVECNNKLSIIGAYVFQGCTSLETVQLNDNLRTLKNYAFQNCSKLINFEIPSNVTMIGEGILNGCENLIRLTVPYIGSRSSTLEEDNAENNKTTSVLGHFFGKDDNGISQQYAFNFFQKYLIPNTLCIVTITNTTFIPYGAFYNCEHIRQVVLSNNITHIGDYSFYNCRRLGRIHLPSNINYIGNYAFALEALE